MSAEKKWYSNHIVDINSTTVFIQQPHLTETQSYVHNYYLFSSNKQ